MFRSKGCKSGPRPTEHKLAVEGKWDLSHQAFFLRLVSKRNCWSRNRFNSTFEDLVALARSCCKQSQLRCSVFLLSAINSQIHLLAALFTRFTCKRNRRAQLSDSRCENIYRNFLAIKSTRYVHLLLAIRTRSYPKQSHAARNKARLGRHDSAGRAHDQAAWNSLKRYEQAN